MGHATAKFRDGGRLVGYECNFGHVHGNSTEAVNCEPGKFAKANLEKLSDEEKARVRGIKESPDFAKALIAAKALGAADDDAAQEVVLRVGNEKILEVRADVGALMIRTVAKPPEKPSAPPKPPAANAGAGATA